MGRGAWRCRVCAGSRPRGRESAVGRSLTTSLTNGNTAVGPRPAPVPWHGTPHSRRRGWRWRRSARRRGSAPCTLRREAGRQGRQGVRPLLVRRPVHQHPHRDLHLRLRWRPRPPQSSTPTRPSSRRSARRPPPAPARRWDLLLRSWLPLSAARRRAPALARMRKGCGVPRDVAPFRVGCGSPPGCGMGDGEAVQSHRCDASSRPALLNGNPSVLLSGWAGKGSRHANRREPRPLTPAESRIHLIPCRRSCCPSARQAHRRL